MLPKYILHLPLLLMIVALSSALSLPTSSSLNQPTIPLIPATLSSNLTLSSSAGNLTVNPAIRCDGGSYKRDLRTASCLDALLTIPNDPTPITFGTRGSGVFDVPLPHRWISADGRCIFEVTKSSNVAVGIASMQYMRAAATALRDTCLANGEKNGGIAVGLGHPDHQIGLIMSSYVPGVRCADNFGLPLDSCSDIISHMPVSTDQQTFISSGQAGVHVEVPDSFYSEDRTCKVTLDMRQTRPPVHEDVAVWYDIWEAVVAIDGMCARFGKGGTFYNLGALQRLFVSLGSGPGGGGVTATS